MACKSLNHFIGWRFVIVQFIHHAQDLILAQAKAVIGQQLIVDHVLVGRMNARTARICSSSALTPGISGVRAMKSILGNVS